MASIYLKWKKLGITRNLARAGRLTKLSNQERWALVREVTKNPMVTLTELQETGSLEMGNSFRSTTITAILHQFGLYGRVATWKPHLSVKHMKVLLEFAKNHLKDSRIVRNKIFWSDECRIELFCFLAAGTGRRVRVEGRLKLESICNDSRNFPDPDVQSFRVIPKKTNYCNCFNKVLSKCSECLNMNM